MLDGSGDCSAVMVLSMLAARCLCGKMTNTVANHRILKLICKGIRPRCSARLCLICWDARHPNHGSRFQVCFHWILSSRCMSMVLAQRAHWLPVSCQVAQKHTQCIFFDKQVPPLFCTRNWRKTRLKPFNPPGKHQQFGTNCWAVWWNCWPNCWCVWCFFPFYCSKTGVFCFKI